MPTIKINNVQYYYEEHGSGDETIIFSHGLLWSGRMFDQQVAHLKENYRVITYDHRGQGRTQAPEAGYDMETLYEDAIQLIEKLVGKPVIFAGLSMGGFIGMRLAARRADLIKQLILMETSCDPEAEESVRRYTLLTNIVRMIGFFPVVSNVMKIMYGKTFLSNPARKKEKKYWINQLMQNNRQSVPKAVLGVINRKGITHELRNIHCPTLVLVGDEDVATVIDKSKKISSLIKNSELVVVANAGHTSCVEEPEQVNRAIDNFLPKHQLSYSYH